MIHKRIVTTVLKAKEASSFADRMVQLAKRGNELHARRLLISKLGCAETADTLIREIAPRFSERNGGYTRVLRMGSRVGDGADTALLEFTATIEAPSKPKKVKKEKEKATEPKRDDSSEMKKEKTKEKELDKKKPSRDEKPEEKKESEKKGGFLGTLRRFLKGDE